ncbi:MAG TPA: GntR family transcriptional regulator [Anaerolineae bacterium]|jgi:DNA-binding GntR family transcriptional regulator|nr:GntR family transcriptional regulator [Anaerolineae bacterium]
MVTAASHEMLLSEIRHKPLRHTVRTRIEEAIVQGTFKGGEKLNEAKLCRALGVSRGSVREALRELEASGVLVSIPYRGTFVKEWTPRSVWELYTLRSSLEEFSIELAVERASEEDLRDLDLLVQTMHEAAQADDAAQLVEIDLQFHQHLHQMTGHRLLQAVLQGLAGQTRMFIIATKAFYSPFASLEEAAASHDPIVDALRARDPHAARNAIREHIKAVGERYVEQLEAAESDDG